jgi:hypothetical protein
VLDSLERTLLPIVRKLDGAEQAALVLSDANPQPPGTAAPGTSSEASRADHVHPSGGGGSSHDPVTIGTPNGLSLSGQQLSLAAATTGAPGAMSAADKTKVHDAITLGTANGLSLSGQQVSLAAAGAAQAGALTTGAQTIAGAKTFTSPLRAPDGTNAAPAISFESDPDTGIRRTGENAITIVLGGNPRVFITEPGNVAIAGELATDGPAYIDGDLTCASGISSGYGFIHSQASGFKFPDNSVQAKAAPALSDANPQPPGTATPGVSTDAARADHVHASEGGGGGGGGAIPNLCINGNAQIWQRAITATLETNPGGRVFIADRWSSYTAHGTWGYWDFDWDLWEEVWVVTGWMGYTFSRQSSGFATSQYCMRLFQVSRAWSATAAGHTPAQSPGAVHWQEIDRDYVRLMRGRKVSVRFKARKGSALPAGSTITFRVVTSASADTWILTSYASPTNEISEAIQGDLTTSWQEFTFTSSAVVGDTVNCMAVGWWRANASGDIAADANDYIEVADVQVVGGETVPPVEYSYAGGSFVGEVALCRKYYSKSYELETLPGTNTLLGIHQTTVMAVATASAAAWLLGSHPRFPVPMFRVPNIGRWLNSGSEGNWSIGGTARSVGSVSPSREGFLVSNTTGGSVTPTAGHALGHWAANAEI